MSPRETQTESKLAQTKWRKLKKSIRNARAKAAKRVQHWSSVFARLQQQPSTSSKQSSDTSSTSESLYDSESDRNLGKTNDWGHGGLQYTSGYARAHSFTRNAPND